MDKSQWDRVEQDKSLSIRDDIAWQCYPSDEKSTVASYLLSENQFMLLQDDAAEVVNSLLQGRTIHDLLATIRQEKGVEAVAQTEEFLNDIVPLFFDVNPPETPPVKTSRQRIFRPAGEGYYSDDEETNFFFWCSDKFIPASVSFEITYACQLHCIHCYNPHHMSKNELPLGRWLSLLDEARELGLLRITLTGGDPTCSSSFWRIIEKCRSLYMAIDVFTNGWAFSEMENAERLAGSYPRSVQCSLYGATPSTHDEITGVNGSWDRTLACLRHFRQLGVPLAIKCPAMNVNVQEIPGVAEIARELGATLQVDVNITARNDGSAKPTQLRLEADGLERLLCNDDLPLYTGMEKLSTGKATTQKDNEMICGAGTSGYGVQPDGNVIPCLSFQYSLGNVASTPLTDILADSPLTHWRSLLRSDCKACVDCGIRGYCAFCPGNSILEHGNITAANSNDCFIAKIRHNVVEDRFRPERIQAGD